MTADRTVAAAQAYTRELDEARKRFDEALKSHPKKPSRLTKFPVRSLTWLALAPTWPTDLAELGFPGEDGFVTGTAASENLRQICAARLSEFGTADDGSGDVFTMNSAQRSAVLDFLQTLPDQETRSQGVRSYIRKQLTEASGIMLEAGERGEVFLTAPLQRWANLASHAESEDGVAKFLKKQIEAALAGARERGQIVSPEALRWIEAAEPFVKWLGTPMEWGVVQACRRIELFYREAYDDRSLKNYFIRSYQEEIFTQLLPEDPGTQTEHRKDKAQHWALHYVGLGGTGKTMLMRRISAQLATKMNLAVARIDFDRLNPDYPARAPGLLLMSFAEELRLRAGDTSADLFERFDKEVEHLHQNIEASYDAHNPLLVTIDDTAFQSVLRPFIQALTKLAERKRIVLILDTCEELAKLRSDGSLPDSVRVTFEILERIHERLPSVRVIFAGRRPLASAGHLLPSNGSEKHYNWTCPVSQLPPRDYLRLYEIRGFTTEESEKFLEQYTGPNGAKVKREFFTAILQQSCSADKTFDSRFEWHDGRVETEDSRYNPYDLDMFAEWVCADSDVGEPEINAGATQYVKDRIMKRLDYHVKSLLPEIVLLGRFDEKMMRQLIEAKGEHFESLFNELISQEWLDVDRSATLSGTVWALDNIMRKRLYNYYESEEASMFAKAKRFVADFLYQLTLNRDWKELSPAYFDAAARVLIHNKKKAADWWEQVENRLAEAGQWTWAKELTDQLLADDGPVFRADPTLGTQLADESVLRPAVLATQAAAITHLIGSTPGVDGTTLMPIWSEVVDKVHRHPDAKAALKLKHRAVTGKFAALRWHPELGPPELFAEWDKYFEQLPELDVVDENTAASKIAMLEALVEISEDLTLDPGLTKNDTAKLGQIYSKCYEESPLWLSNLPDDLKVFFITLGGRLQKLCGLHKHAVQTLNKALEQLNRMSTAQSLPHRLDWHRPEDFAARITLECVRALYPSYSEPEQVLTSVQSQALGDEGMNTLDADRLASLLTQIMRYGGVGEQASSDDESIKWSISVQNIRPFCTAHRQVPALFSSLLEVEFSSGRISQAIEKCLEISRQAENSKPPALHLQKTAERELLRMAVRTHLRDERGILFGDSLAKAKFESLEDINLRFHAYALDGPRNTTTLQSYFQPKMDEQRRACLLHIGWRSGKDTGAGNNRFELGRSDVNATFIQFSLALDLIENTYLSTASSKRPSNGPKTDGLVDLSLQWAKANVHQPVEALTLLLRSFALNSQAAPLDNILDPLVKKMGPLRAAEIALEEGTLLALRMPAKGIPLLMLAHGWYQDCKDTFGKFVTTVRTAMLYAAVQRKDELSQSLQTMKGEYEACRVAANVELPTWEQLESLPGESQKATVNDDIPKLLTGLESLRSWRPLIVRVLGCLIREREFTTAQGATGALMTWVRSNYSTTIGEQQQVIPPDISYLFSYKETSVITKEKPSLISRMRESTIVRIIRAVGLITLTLAFVVIGYGAIARFIEYLFSFVYPIRTRTSVLLTIGLTLLLSQVAEIWRRLVTLSTRKILVENVDEVKDPNRPLLSRLKLEMWSGIVSYHVSLATIDAQSDDSYRELAEVVPQKLRKKWKRINRWAGKRLVHTKIVVDDTNCAAPWEAIRGLPSEDIRSFEKSRVLSRRNLKLRDVTRLDKVNLPVQIVTLASSVSQTELGQNSWRMDEARLRPKYFLQYLKRAGIQSPALQAVLHEIDKPGEYLKGVFPDFDVVHILGTPTQTSLGVRLEVQGAEGVLEEIYEKQESGSQSSNRSESRNQSYLLSGEEVARFFPRLRICVVQCDVANDDSRDSTTRYEAALLRRFGAELFKCGIPAVILLPPLPEEVAAAAIQELNNMITLEVERGPRRGWHKRTSLAQTVRLMQENIARTYDDNEQAIEIAFDVCLYMEDDFDFDIAQPPGWSRRTRNYHRGKLVK